VSPGDEEASPAGLVAGRVARREVHDGRILRLTIDTVRLPDGSVRDYEMIRHAGASAILPVVGRVEEADPEVLLIRQYRYATGGYLYEVPAGMPDRSGEPWEEVARRELEEETGWRAGRLVPLTWIWTTPGFTDERIHLWLATDLEPGASNLDDDEFVEVVRVPVSRALEWVREGRIVDAKSVATLLYATRFALGNSARRD
jgi:ADP-ribose pyrophosphatase